ncbi:MAG: hypothetical protein AAB387_11070, partial [candidate division NC10 bacterium]
MRRGCVVAALLALLATPVPAFAQGSPPGAPPALAGVRTLLGRATRDAPGIQNAVTQAAYLMNIAELQARAGDADGALKTVAALQSPGLKAMGLLRLAQGQAAAGDVAGTLRTLEQVKGADTAKTMALVVAAQARARDVSTAVKTATAIQNPGWRNAALREIAMVQRDAGDLEGALRTAALLQNPTEKLDTFRDVAVAYARLGDAKGVDETAVAAFRVIPDANIWPAIAEAWAERGDVKGALQSAVPIADPHWRDRTLGRIA